MKFVVGLLASSLVIGCSGAGSPSAPPSAGAPAAAVTPAPVGTRTPLPTASSGPSPRPLPGGRLAYGRFYPSGVTAFTASTDGTGEQALLSGNAEGPRWSTDGRRLSVVVESPQGLVFAGVVNADGTGYKQFGSPDAPLQLGCFAWSPDASRLACEGWDDTNPTRNGLYTVRASDGGDVTRLTTSPDGGHDVPGDYSPDGRQIVFSRAQHDRLMVVNVDGRGEHTLSDGKVDASGSWSPDGTNILTDAGGSLLLVPVDGGQPSPITIDEATDGRALRPNWSPDGDWIVFSLNVHGASHSDIYIMRKEGTDLHQITNTPGEDEEFGDWGVTP